jgi:hypothetical protein
VRDGVTTPHFQAGHAHSRSLQAALDGANHQVACIKHQFAGTLPLDLDDQSGIDCLDDDFVVDIQRESDTVEARAEVGAGRRDDRAGQQSGRQQLGTQA